MANDFYRQLGIGVSSLTFGVALSIFIYAAASGFVGSLTAGLLFATSFLLMLRFWWRYNELFVQQMPSKNFWHFVFDFLISFFGILAVLSVGDMQKWAMLGALAMLSSIVRCAMSWKGAGVAKQKLIKTLYGAVSMLIIMGAVYVTTPLYDQLYISAAIFVVTLVFVVYSAARP